MWKIFVLTLAVLFLVADSAHADPRYEGGLQCGVDLKTGTAQSFLLIDRRQATKGVRFLFTEANDAGLVCEHEGGSTDAVLFTGERVLRSVLEPGVSDRMLGVKYERYMPVLYNGDNFDLGIVGSVSYLWQKDQLPEGKKFSPGVGIRARFKPYSGRIYFDVGVSRTKLGHLSAGIDFLHPDN